MLDAIMPRRSRRGAGRVLCLVLSGLGPAAGLTGCASEARTFATPETAVDSLVVALRADDQRSLEKILGGDAREALSSGDDVADANRRTEFLRLYDEKHRLSRDDDASVTLEVGASDWPMPIPVVKGDKGWYFDTDAGLDEMLARRIGRNELDAIQTCLAIVDAQREYAAGDFTGSGWREYARTFASDPGQKNGLFWPANTSEPQSPLGPLVAAAAAEGYTRRNDGRTPYHGYYFRILTRQGSAAPGGAIDYVVGGHMIGGFGLVAWPAEYGKSGIKTFITSHNGLVYERDLGENTGSTASSIEAFNPETGWDPCGNLNN